MRIFLVENHPVTLDCVRRHLQRLGHEVETAETVAATLRDLPAKPRDLLIADLGLPDGDGCDLLESLGSARPSLAVAMSGYGSPADQARSRAAGFQQHLTKPFLPAELDRVLRQLAVPETRAAHPPR
jgi:DNA-binding response OmpR family regulator